jgi:hypothetical protein
MPPLWIPAVPVTSNVVELKDSVRLVLEFFFQDKFDVRQSHCTAVLVVMAWFVVG